MDKFIFVHIYRCGGNSIRTILNKDNIITNQHQSHATASEIMDFHGKEYFESVFKFSFVRNPFDHLVSLYEFIRKYPTHHFHQNVIRMRFGQFIKWYHSQIIKKSRTDNGGLHTMKDFLYKGDELLVNFVGKFENFAEDINYICKKLNIKCDEIPKINSVDHPNYKTYYDTSLIDLVYNNFKEDLNTFDYAW